MALSLLAAMAAGSPASAGSVDGMKAQVPFDFYVGGRLIPAGEYTVRALTDDEAALRITRGRESANVITNLAEEGRRRGARLIFRRYGDHFFLAAVWGADGTGRALSESKRERRMREELRAKRGEAAPAEVVILAAR
jgi:hypothetical protein